MGDGTRVALASARLQFHQYNRSRVIVVLAVLEAITFLVLVSLFGLTGSRAPTALVDLDQGPYAASFIEHLKSAHHSFDLRPMSLEAANEQVAIGDLAAIIVIPKDFSADLAAGKTALLPVTVDNVNADMTDDIKGAVPSTVTAFARDHQFSGVRVVATERDTIDHDTGYVPYLVVSSLALTALVVCGILGALAITSEYEGGTIVQWQLAPVGPGWLLLGKLLAAAAVGSVAVAAATAVVVLGYRVPVRYAGELVVGLGMSVIIFTALGAAIGTLVRRTLPVAAIFFGIALPLYLDSGAIEPVRFDGETLYILAHLTPAYPAVSVIEHAFHGLRVEPETLAQNFITLALWTVVAVVGAIALLHRRFATR